MWHRSRWLAYGSSKQANILFTLEAARRWTPLGILPTAFFPGLVRSRFAGTSPLFMLGKLIPVLFASPRRATDTLLWLADAPARGKAAPGGYYFLRQPFAATPRSTSRPRAARLWQSSLAGSAGPDLRLLPAAGARPAWGQHLAGAIRRGRRAVQRGVHGRAAVAVDGVDRRTLRVGQVAVAPLGDRDQHRVEVEALLGEPVLVAGPAPGPGTARGAARPCSTRRPSRLVSTCRGMPVCTRMSSKRRTPLNTSRSTTKVQRSPRIAIARPTVQFSTDQARAAGSRKS